MIEILLYGVMALQISILLILYRKDKNKDILSNIKNAILRFDNSLDRNEKAIKDEFQRSRKEYQDTAKMNRDELNKSLNSFSIKFEENSKALNDIIYKQLRDIREDNSSQLSEMRKTVDEKLHETLEKRLGESFKQVSERLEQVHKGLGEMQTIATGVGDLKRVLSNVKTRGVLGEYQLENILENILTPDQYSKNVATKKGSQANVEFAIKLPGKDSDNVVWMPIDSKFPIESYEVLLTAHEGGDKKLIEAARKVLIKNIESFAKDIHTKYVDPPHTTDFAIMFLPAESLYAEVLRDSGFFETLQRKYKITVTGPTTLSALLSSLNMGFRTLAVQKRSSEVWTILEAVKTEFSLFTKHLDDVDKSLNTASNKLQTLRSTRTNVMNTKLKEVSTIDSGEAEKILEIEK
jgi:DNA recombination protein RmuC